MAHSFKFPTNVTKPYSMNVSAKAKVYCTVCPFSSCSRQPSWTDLFYVHTVQPCSNSLYSIYCVNMLHYIPQCTYICPLYTKKHRVQHLCLMLMFNPRVHRLLHITYKYNYTVHMYPPVLHVSPTVQCTALLYSMYGLSTSV